MTTETVKQTALTTIRRLELELDAECGDDVRKQEYFAIQINQVSAAIERYLNRKLSFKAGIVEDRAGFGLPRLTLRRAPIVTLTAVELIGSFTPLVTDPINVAEIQIEDNEDGENEGVLYYSRGWPDTGGRSAGIAQTLLAGTEEQALRFTYDGGYVTPEQAKDGTLTVSLPDDLQQAAVFAAASNIRRRGGDRNIKKEKNLSYSVEYMTASDAGDLSGGSGLPPFVVEMIEPYRFHTPGY